jgi:2-succinyl-6-hydroxy-2,4-cyclohexadiene-1-carboxylate synthase
LGKPKNPSLIFIHVFMGEGKDWLPIAQEFSRRYCCYLIDLPGHGKSPLKEFADFASFAHSMMGFLRNLSDTSYLVGYSLGGRLALYLSIFFPQWIHKTVMLSASAGIVGPHEQKRRYERDLKLFEGIHSRDEFENFLRAWYEQPLFNPSSILKKQLIAKRVTNNVQYLRRSLGYLSVGIQPSLWPKIKTLQVPILYMSGLQDIKYHQLGKNLAKMSSMIVFQGIEGSGHLVHLEQPQKVKNAIASFLTN